MEIGWLVGFQGHFEIIDTKDDLVVFDQFVKFGQSIDVKVRPSLSLICVHVRPFVSMFGQVLNADSLRLSTKL